MNDIKVYIQTLFEKKQVEIPFNRSSLFDEFVNEEVNASAVQQIFDNQKMLMEKWYLKNKVSDILHKHVTIPNGTVGKPYEAKFDLEKLGSNDIVYSEWEGLDEVGLSYDKVSATISGTPTQSGDMKVSFIFRIHGESEDSILNEKKISLIINPDPKTLWKNQPSDRNDPFHKEDEATAFAQLGEKSIVAVSKRGRSHANVGSFREDDFTYKFLEDTGWSIVAVADGAGSAKLSREGSRIACKEVVNYFSENFKEDSSESFKKILQDYKNEQNEEREKEISQYIYNMLSKAVISVHQKIAETVTSSGESIKDFHTTLIFSLFKKFEIGYVILSFGVGDCPIGLLNKDMTEIKLMNWLDVGEFGGGTRFVTMPEIFSSEKFATRFGFKLIDDFSYLILMTDGIYDPKFVVEANLEKIETWQAFIEDLKGNNEDKCKIDFSPGNSEITAQLSKWIDFWSAGNHDDRTLAIVF